MDRGVVFFQHGPAIDKRILVFAQDGRRVPEGHLNLLLCSTDHLHTPPPLCGILRAASIFDRFRPYESPNGCAFTRQ